MTLPTSSLSPTSHPPQTFQPFPLLPTELRLKIWTHILHLTKPAPITITFLPRPSTTSSFSSSSSPPSSISSTAAFSPGAEKPQMWEADNTILHRGRPIPVLLHVCAESREVGFRIGGYVMGFEVCEELRALPFNHCWRRVE